VVEALVAVDREGGGALVVEGAEALPGPPGFLQARVLADDLDDVGRRAQLREDVVVDVEVAHRSSTIVAPLPPSRASAWRTEAAAGWLGRCSRRPSRRRPVPWPWTTRRRASPARSVASRAFSTSSVASSRCWPMTLTSRVGPATGPAAGAG